MKPFKNTLLLLAALLGCALLSISCNKKGLEPAPGPEPEPVPYDWPAAPFAGHAVRYANVHSVTGKDAVLDTPELRFASLSLTEGGTFVIVNKQRSLKGTGPGVLLGEDNDDDTLPTLLAGSYEPLSDGVYRLPGFGTVTVTNPADSKADDDKTKLTFDPYELGLDEYTVTVLAYSATQEEALFRLWKVQRTRLTLSGQASVSADFDGCDLNEIQAFLHDNGVELGRDIPGGSAVTGVDVSALGELTILYRNGAADYARWQRNDSGAFLLRWNGKNMGPGFEAASVEADFDYDKCILSFLGTVTTSSGSTDVALRWVLTL